MLTAMWMPCGRFKDAKCWVLEWWIKKSVRDSKKPSVEFWIGGSRSLWEIQRSRVLSSGMVDQEVCERFKEVECWVLEWWIKKSVRDSKKPSVEFWNGGSRSLWEIQRSRVLSSGMVDQEVCERFKEAKCWVLEWWIKKSVGDSKKPSAEFWNGGSRSLWAIKRSRVLSSGMVDQEVCGRFKEAKCWVLEWWIKKSVGDSKKPSAEFWNGGSRSLWEIQRSRVLSSGMVDQEVCGRFKEAECWVLEWWIKKSVRDSKKPSAEFWNGGSRSLWEIQRSQVLSSGMVDEEVCGRYKEAECWVLEWWIKKFVRDTKK